MQQFQLRMDVIGNNIANVNTTGYKSSRVEFVDSFSQTLKAASAGTATSGSLPGTQVGTGVATGTIKTVFKQGAIGTTSVPTDLAILEDGFFIVRDVATGNTFATRDGSFRVDDQGYLVSGSGLRVQGFTDAALTTRGDIKIDDVGKPAGSTAKLESFKIGDDGKINVRLTDDTQFDRAQILLQKFSDPQALTKAGQNLYSGINGAGPLGGAGSPTAQPPGTNGLGKVKAGALELSSVSLADEFTDMITTQRAFQAGARVITTSDEMLQELVGLKR